MANEDGKIGIMHFLIHDYMVANIIVTEVNKIIVVFAVMIHNLLRVPEFFEYFVSKERFYFCLGILSVQSIAADELDVLLLNSDLV